MTTCPQEDIHAKLVRQLEQSFLAKYGKIQDTPIFDMTLFDTAFKELVTKESAILHNKGKEYTRSSSDPLSNFKRLAEQLKLTKEQVWAVYFQKHIDSIMNYIQEGKTFSDESIEGRIMDARNYLYLFYLMVKENSE